jgi:hypothetical protein
VNSYGLKPAKEEEQQQQLVWNTATTSVMWSLSVSHTSSVGERERDPLALQQLCTARPANPPRFFHLHHIMKASFETKFPVFYKHSDQVGWKKKSQTTIRAGTAFCSSYSRISRIHIFNFENTWKYLFLSTFEKYAYFVCHYYEKNEKLKNIW